MNNFDWVPARDNCSTSEAFEEVCAGIEKDVDARNKLSNKTAYACQRTEDSLAVIRTEDRERVAFTLIRHQIVVSGYRIQSPRQNVVQRVFIACLDSDGACYLVEVDAVDDGFLRTRSIRESTLDALFFDSQSDCPRFR